MQAVQMYVQTDEQTDAQTDVEVKLNAAPPPIPTDGGINITIAMSKRKYSQTCLKGHLYITNHCL